MILHEVLHGQTIYDICKFYYTNLNKLDILMSDNNLDLNSDLVSGQIINIRPSEIPLNSKYKQDKSYNNASYQVFTKTNEAEQTYAIRQEFRSDENPRIYMVNHGQSVFDISLQLYENIDEGLDILLADNNLNISSQLVSGQLLNIRPEMVKNVIRVNKQDFVKPIKKNIYLIDSEGNYIITRSGERIIIKN